MDKLDADIAQDLAKEKAGKEYERKLAAGTKAANALPKLAENLKRTIDAFERGDQFGGAAGVMDFLSTTSSLLGSVASVSSLGGPVGALFGAIFGIISLVLRSFEEHQKSLADQLEERLRKLQAEDKGQTTQAAIDEFQALYASYPTESRPGPVKVHRYLDALAQGNARDNLLKTNYWLVEKRNSSEPEISAAWLQVLEYSIQAGTLEMRNLMHLAGMADPEGPEYAYLYGVLREIAGQHRKATRSLLEAALGKCEIIRLNAVLEADGYQAGPRPKRRLERGVAGDWDRGGWKYKEWTDLTGEFRTLTVARNSSGDRTYLLGLEGQEEHDKYTPFHAHKRAYVMSRKGESGGDWDHLTALDNSTDVWAFADPEVPNGVRVNAINATKTAVIHYTLDFVEKKFVLDQPSPNYAIEAETGQEFLMVREVRAKDAYGAYILVKQGGGYHVQVGNRSNQKLYLPKGFNIAPRGIAVDDERIWVYRHDPEKGEAELIGMTHKDAAALQSQNDEAKCLSAWKHYQSWGETWLDRKSNVKGAANHAGITWLAGASGGLLTMCFNGHIYTGLVGEVDPVDSSKIQIEWSAYDPKAKAIVAVQTPPSVLPLLRKRLSVLDAVLAQDLT